MEKETKQSISDECKKEMVSAAMKKAEKICETQKNQGGAYKAIDKLYDLLSCGDKRIELSAAKEILGLMGVPDGVSEDSRVSEIEVTINLIE